MAKPNRQTTVPTAHSLAGRSDELDRLRKALGDGDSGLRGVLLLGDPGIGKTALVESFLASWSGAHGTAHCTEQTTSPYALLSELARAARRAGGVDAAASGEAFEHSLEALIGVPVAGARPDTEHVSRSTLLRGALRHLANAARERTILLVIEDIHWGDADSIELLPALFHRLQSSPVRLVMTARTHGHQQASRLRWLRAELMRLSNFEEMALGPLRADGVRTLLEQRLGNVVAPALVQRLATLTHGVPFYLIETLTWLVQNAQLAKGAEGWDAPDGEPASLPDTVREMVQARSASLSGKGQHALAMAAVMGSSFSLEDLLSVTHDDQGLEELLSTGWLREVEPPRASFAHSMVRKVLYAALPWTRRRQLHRDAADALAAKGAPPRAQAPHLWGAGDADKACAAWVAAAEASQRSQAYGDAAAQWEQALKIWPEGFESHKRDAAERELAMCRRYLAGSAKGKSPDKEVSGALTPRQREIMALVAEGLTGKEIGDRLNLSPRTVEMHIGLAMERLDCRSRSEAVKRAADLGMI